MSVSEHEKYEVIERYAEASVPPTVRCRLEDRENARAILNSECMLALGFGRLLLDGKGVREFEVRQYADGRRVEVLQTSPTALEVLALERGCTPSSIVEAGAFPVNVEVRLTLALGAALEIPAGEDWRAYIADAMRCDLTDQVNAMGLNDFDYIRPRVG